MHRVEALNTAVRDLQTEAEGLRTAVERHTRTLRRRTRWIAVLLALIVALGAAAVWQLAAQDDATRRLAADQRRLCPVIALLIGDGGPAPSTPRGAELADQARTYSRQLNC